MECWCLSHVSYRLNPSVKKPGVRPKFRLTLEYMTPHLHTGPPQSPPTPHCQLVWVCLFLCRNVWLHVCVCTTYMPGVGSQKRVSWTWSLYGCSSAAMLVLSIELGSSDTSLQPDSKEGSYYAALAGLESLCRSGYICV